MSSRVSPAPESKPVSIYVSQSELDYADELGGKLRRSRSWVFSRGLRALRRERHDYAVELGALNYTADELERGLVTPEEAVAKIRRQVARIVEVMREEG